MSVTLYTAAARCGKRCDQAGSVAGNVKFGGIGRAKVRDVDTSKCASMPALGAFRAANEEPITVLFGAGCQLR